jgi:hypothetical protein
MYRCCVLFGVIGMYSVMQFKVFRYS